jgi:hypothetical protein
MVSIKNNNIFVRESILFIIEYSISVHVGLERLKEFLADIYLKYV